MLFTHPRPSPSRLEHRGTILIFLLATMTIVTVLLHALVRIGEAPGALGSSRELAIVADAMALSGIDLMATIGNYSVESGPQFLKDRQRYLTPGQPYDITTTFRMASGANSLKYLPPVEYPPLSSLSLRYYPQNTATLKSNDIRLPSNVGTSLPSSINYNTVPGTAYQYPGQAAQESAILPNAGFCPNRTDTVDYTTTASSGVIQGASSMLIKAIYKVDITGPPALPWWGAMNDPNATTPVVYMPDTQQIVGENPPVASASQKFPAPSLIFVHDLPVLPSGTARLRAYTYAWYLRSQTQPGNVWYYMSSGRVRIVNIAAAGETLDDEVCVSYTQIR